MKNLKRIVAQVFGINPAKVRDDSSPKEIKAWDSFRGLLLIIGLEKSYSVKFSMEEMMSIRNIGDIRKILERRGVRFDEK